METIQREPMTVKEGMKQPLSKAWRTSARLSPELHVSTSVFVQMKVRLG
jgi:hypothetical protein